MRAVLITSSVTFVPENYNRLVCGLASHPNIVGLIEIENRDPSILAKAVGMMATLSAPRLGAALFSNFVGNSRKLRSEAYKNKFYRIVDNVNSNDTVEFIKNEDIDLAINARTRSIFRKDILNAPKIGCINIHHGLLPVQRGLMCDFWAHMENDDFGFSIHQMTSKIDDGPILHVEKVASDSKHYVQNILKASEAEAKVCRELIDKIAKSNSLDSLNLDVKEFKYRKNPTLVDGYRLQIKGIKI